MLDREGFRPNVGIILLNQRNQVFWGKRIRTHSWQFPQGGIKHGETPEQAMYRELHEEVGLLPEHVPWLARSGVRSFHIGSSARPLGSWKAYVDPDLVGTWRRLVDDAVHRSEPA